MMKTSTKKSAVIALTVIASSTLLSYQTVQAGCGCPPVVDSIWMAAMNGSEAEIQAAITSGAAIIAAQQKTNMMYLESVMRVVTKQVNVANEKMGIYSVKAGEAQANFDNEVATAKATLKAFLDYGPTGQGTNPCRNAKTTIDINTAITESDTDVPAMINQEVAAAPGKLHTSPAEYVATAAADIRGKYCTKELKDAGYCAAVGEMAGKDTDGTLLFRTTTKGSPEDQARSKLVDYIFGPPNAAPEKSMASSVQVNGYMIAKREQDAYRSIAANSLKRVQDWNTDKGDAQPGLMTAIDNKVSIYNGGPEYANWEKALTGQRERGLMIELLKMRAEELQMKQMEYEQLQRQEMIVAGLLALKAKDRSQVDVTANSNAAKSRITQ